MQTYIVPGWLRLTAAIEQVFYHLGELDDALSYALGAGKLFDINEQSEYVQTTLGASSASWMSRMLEEHYSSERE